MTNYTITVLSALLISLPIGTNLALLHFMWMLVSGALLPNRGAIFPALKATGLSDAATRRAWAALRHGVWQIALLLGVWREYVKALPDWRTRRYEGYLPVIVDVTAFWRPALQICPSQHYHPAAQRALPAIIFGICGEVGELNGQRLALPRAFEPVYPPDPSEKRLWEALLKHTHQALAESVQRLPELALLAGSILSFLAASFPPTPTGFWDRAPKRPPGRFRRLLMGQPFPKDAPISGQLREKESVTAHLPKGILARRPKTGIAAAT